MSRPSRRTGFTIIELIAAVVILSLAVPPMLWSIREAHVLRVDAVLSSRARWLVVEKLEDVVADRHGTNRGWSYVVGGNYADETPVASDTQFQRTVSVSETAADLVSVGTGYKTVTVTVSWLDGGGDARSLSIVTVLTEYSA